MRLPYLDALKVYATILVIAVHTAATPVVMIASVSRADWWFANTVDSFARTCVPLFIMASGAALLDRAKLVDLSGFFARRVRKVVVPLIVWIPICYGYKCWLMGTPFRIGDLGAGYLTGNVFYHLPFVYLILGLYLAAPLLVRIVEPMDKRLMWYFAGLWMLALLLPLIAPASAAAMPIYAASGYAGYFVLGRALRDVRIGRAGVAWCAAVVLAGAAFTAWATGRASIPDARFVYRWYDYLTPSVAVMTLASFVALASAPVRGFLRAHGRVDGVMQSAAGVSFGVYLLHPVVLSLLQMLGLGWDTGSIVVGLPLTVAIVGAVAGAAVGGMRLVPWVRGTVP